MKRIVIFGLTELSMVVARSARRDKSHEIAAFCVDRAFLPQDRLFEGSPVVSLDEVRTLYPPAEFDFLCLMSWKRRNRVREAKVNEIKLMGYGFSSYVSAFSIMFPGTRIGSNSVVLDDVVAGPNVRIGDDVVVWQGCTFAHDDIVGDHVYLAPSVAVAGCVTIGENCFVGINASLRDKISLGAGTFVAMGSSVRCNTEPGSSYDGIPAEKVVHNYVSIA